MLSSKIDAATGEPFTTGEVFGPSLGLRWAVPPGTTTKPPVLQQAWVGRRGSVEWRDVPTVVLPTGGSERG